jgi:uncharacterized protein (DUF1800 family)
MNAPKIWSICHHTLLIFVLCFSASAAHAQEVLFTDGFEPARAASDAQAARFLNRATFGATTVDIADLRARNYSAWIDQQISQPASLQRFALQSLAGTFVSTQTVRVDITQNDRLRHWYRTAVYAPDQLRQRLAWALSQIIVVSDQSDALSGEPLMLAEWNDIVVRNAFGNYRNLLQEATRSPTMGRWLTSLRNRKFEGTISPDENYAREVMQLFSIGLIERNLDFSPVVIGGNTIPTYDISTIAAVARAFTGLSYDCTGNAAVAGTDTTVLRNCSGTSTCTGTDCRFEPALLAQRFFNNPPRDDGAANVSGGSNIFRGLLHEDFFRPMVCYPRYNDTGRQPGGLPWNSALGQPTPAKRIVIGGTELLNIAEIGAGQAVPPDCNKLGATITAAERAACLQYCESNVNNIVDLLFNHPNTGPVIAQQLIQRFVTSNPSPAYIRRVACTFGGSTAPLAQCPIRSTNLRGDMAATVRAVLLDPEALATSNAVNFGKSREPLLKLLAIWRSMAAVLPEISNRFWGPTEKAETLDIFGQRPYGAPSVFNFYEPGYQQPGAIARTNINGNPVASDALGLLSPEFKIINEVSSVLTGNYLLNRICNGYGAENCNGSFAATPPGAPYLPPASLDALPLSDDIALIEALNTRLMGGSMTGTMVSTGACASGLAAGGVGTGMKGILYRLMRCEMPAQVPGFGSTVDDRRRKALYLLHIIAVSPEYNTQR